MLYISNIEIEQGSTRFQLPLLYLNDRNDVSDSREQTAIINHI